MRFDHSCRRGASDSGAPITVAMVNDGYGLANASTSSQRPASATDANSSSRDPRLAGPQQLVKKPAHGGPPAIGGARRERRVDQVAQARVVGAVDVQDVALHLLA